MKQMIQTYDEWIFFFFFKIQQYDMHEILQLKWSDKITRMVFFFKGYANKETNSKWQFLWDFWLWKQNKKETNKNFETKCK